jgi:hypothetical protein
MTDNQNKDHFPDVGNMIEDDHSTEVSDMIDEFRYGVGEGSHIDRVPLPEKVRNQTSVLAHPQESNDCLRRDGRGSGVKFPTLKFRLNLLNRGIRGLFYSSKFK